MGLTRGRQMVITVRSTRADQSQLPVSWWGGVNRFLGPERRCLVYAICSRNSGTWGLWGVLTYLLQRQGAALDQDGSGSSGRDEREEHGDAETVRTPLKSSIESSASERGVPRELERAGAPISSTPPTDRSARNGALPKIPRKTSSSFDNKA